MSYWTPPDLHPCPFCDSTKLRIISAAEYFDDHSCVGTTVLCECGAHCGFIKTSRAAAERWNRRDCRPIVTLEFDR